MSTDDRSPEAIEQDIEARRHRVDRGLEELEKKLSPGDLLDQALSYVKDGPADGASEFGSKLGRQVRDNPMPVALVGIGLAWLAMGAQERRELDDSDHRRMSYPHGNGARTNTMAATGTNDHSEDLNVRMRAHVAADQIKQQAGEAKDAFERRRYQAMAKVLKLKDDAEDSASDLKMRVNAAMDAADERRRALMQRASEGADEVKRQAGETIDEARRQAEQGVERARRQAESVGRDALDLFHRQPLLGAAAGVTIGALLGAIMPPTEREDELMGDERDRLADDLKARGQAKGEKIAHHAVSAAEGAIEGARQEARSTA